MWGILSETFTYTLWGHQRLILHLKGIFTTPLKLLCDITFTPLGVSMTAV